MKNAGPIVTIQCWKCGHESRRRLAEALAPAFGLVCEVCLTENRPSAGYIGPNPSECPNCARSNAIGGESATCEVHCQYCGTTYSVVSFTIGKRLIRKPDGYRSGLVPTTVKTTL